MMGAVKLSHARDDWWSFYQRVMAADRTLYPSAMRHQGDFFRAAFEGHGIDARLRDFCAPWPETHLPCMGPYCCHGVPLTTSWLGWP